MRNVGGSQLFARCNFHKKEINNLNIPEWYKIVFSVFLKDIRKNRHLPKHVMLWNNPKILIQGKTVFYDNFHKIGIDYISDLFIKETALDSFTYWVGKGLPRPCIMQWYGLRSACSKLKPTFSKDNFPAIDNPPLLISIKDHDIIEIKSTFKARNFYILLMNNQEMSFPTSMNKLRGDFNISQQDMYLFYSLAHKIKAENVLKELQYRIITFTYNTNCLLFKKKLCNTVFCDFCLIEEESIYHLFYDCDVVSRFWKTLESYWQRNTKMQISLTRRDVILGNTIFSNVLNLILLLGKFYIHKSKISKIKPKLELFIPTLRDRYYIEENMFSKQGKEDIFLARWSFVP